MDAALSMTRAVSFQVPFSVILGTFLSFRAFSFVIPSALFCHSEPERGIRSWMLRCAQHDRTESVIPNASEESSVM